MVLFLTPIQPGLPRLHKKTQTRKKFTIITGSWTKIHPSPKPNELMESAQKVIVCSAPYTSDSTLLENCPAKGQPPTTPNYMSNQNGHPHIGQSLPSHWRNAYHVSPWLSINCSKHAKAKQTSYHTNNEHYECCNNNRHS